MERFFLKTLKIWLFFWNYSKIVRKSLFFNIFGIFSFLNQKLGLRKSFLNQATYVLKNWLYQQSFLNQDSFLNRAFLNRELTVPRFNKSLLKILIRWKPIISILIKSQCYLDSYFNFFNELYRPYIYYYTGLSRKWKSMNEFSLQPDLILKSTRKYGRQSCQFSQPSGMGYPIASKLED